MILHLEVIDTQSKSRTFSILDSDLGAALDVVTLLVQKGNQITQMYLIEDGKWVAISPAIIDGHSFSDAFHLLESEWTALINLPTV